MGFLEDLELDEVEVIDDWTIPNGVYPAMITSSELITTSSGDNSWRITYTIDPEFPQYGKRTVSEFFTMDPNATDLRKMFLKRRLKSLGFYKDEIRTMEPSDVLGIEVNITVKNRQSGDKTYSNVTAVDLSDDTTPRYKAPDLAGF